MVLEDAPGGATENDRIKQAVPAAVVLAAGKGTRMKSYLPKVLHPLLGEPMLYHLLRTLRQTGIPPERTAIIVGYEAEKVGEAVRKLGDYALIDQPEQLGTGHALQQALPFLNSLAEKPEDVMVLLGDGPLVLSKTLQQLIEIHQSSAALVSMITAETAEPTGYGRIVRDKSGHFSQIIEELDLTPAQKSITEINPSLYMLRFGWMREALYRLKPNPLKGEIYLTDLPGMAVEEVGDKGPFVQTLKADLEEVLGVNDRVQLSEAELILRKRILRQHMLNGITITDPATTYISATAEIGPDTIIEPNTHVKGNTCIGQNCVIGPNTILIDATIGDKCTVLASLIERSELEREVNIGPFSRIRPGCYLETGAYMGNFAEASRSRIGANTKQGHFSFVGDATIGYDVNIGAGTITANYDGKYKHKTTLGNNVFTGSGTVLRAPVTMGDNSKTGAGAVVTNDVEPGETVVGVPARPIKRKSHQEESVKEE
jgi:bifunctional UDP-N-acetylglucosamine pyrophosphorylase/glucosamine-1-phosphate N-acetyltransferase